MASDLDRLRELLVGGGKYDEEEFAALLAGWDRRTSVLQHLVTARALDGAGARTIEMIFKGYVSLPRAATLALFAPPARTGSKVQEQLGMSQGSEATPSPRPRTPSREEVRAAVSAALDSAGLRVVEPAAGASGAGLKLVGEQSEGTGLQGQVAPGARGREATGPRRRRETPAWVPATGRSQDTGPQRQVRQGMSERAGEGVRTLAEMIAAGGPLDARAVARIGADLAWDLWAAGGHGDVRAERVLVAGAGPGLGARLTGPRRGGAVREDMQGLGATLLHAATGREPPAQAGREAVRAAGLAPPLSRVIAELLSARDEVRAEAWESMIAALTTAAG